MRQTTTAEVRADGGQSNEFRRREAALLTCQRVGYDQISLRRRANKTEITPNSPGIWRMSVSMGVASQRRVAFARDQHCSQGPHCSGISKSQNQAN